MNTSLAIAVAQFNPVVGDLAGNTRLILDAMAEAEARSARLLLTPELSICGYPPEDLLLKPGFIADNRAALEKVAAATRSCVAVVGFVGAMYAVARLWLAQSHDRALGAMALLLVGGVGLAGIVVGVVVLVAVVLGAMG